MNRIIEIASDTRHLSLYRGFMLISEGRAEIARIPLDSMSALVVTGYGVTYSHNLLVALAEHGVVIVLCNKKHHPTAILHVYEGHHQLAGRIDSQIDGGKPLYKGLWQQIIKSKIANQASVIHFYDGDWQKIDSLSARVLSGDSQNREAWAARLYFPQLFGHGFKRDRDEGGINAFLNYGYMVVRACVARYVVASGLSPAIGIYHKNKLNPMRLVDDLLEPYRPYVDAMVRYMHDKGANSLTPEIKEQLCSVLEKEVWIAQGQKLQGSTYLHKAIEETVQSFVKCLDKSEKKLILPQLKKRDKDQFLV